MAVTISHFTYPIVASAASINPKKPLPNQRSSQSNKWWAPLFGWSPEPDYIETEPDQEEVLPNPDTHQSKSCLRGRLTEEKARKLRKKTIETSNFHDVMYHSAIDSRLASAVSR